MNIIISYATPVKLIIKLLGSYQCKYDNFSIISVYYIYIYSTCDIALSKVWLLFPL